MHVPRCAVALFTAAVTWSLALPGSPLYAAAPPTKTGGSLTFEETVNRALSSASRVKQAELALTAQIEKRRATWANAGPKVSATYNDVRFPNKLTAKLPAGEGQPPINIVMRDDRSQTGSLTAVQPLTGLFALVEQARFEGTREELEELALELAKREVAFQAGEAWLRAKQAARNFEIFQSSVVATEAQLKDANALERAGRLNRGDVLKLELAVSDAKTRLAQARAGREVAFAVLREAIGASPGTAVEIDAAMPKLTPDTLPSPENAVRDAFQKRIELRQAERGRELADFGRKLAAAQFLPSVNAFYKFDRNFGAVSGLGGEKDTRSYGIMLEWELWNNGSRIFAMRSASAEIQKAGEQHEAAQQGVRLEVLQTLANLGAASETLTLSEVAVKQAEEGYRLEQVRFRSGSRSATDVVLAESSQVSAQGRQVSAVTDYLSWKLHLQRVSGAVRPTL